MRIIVTGGGTGGHIFPGIAVAKGIQDKFPGSKVMFIGTDRHIDQKALAAYNFQLAAIKCLGIKGKSFFNKLNSIIQLPGALLAAIKIMKTFKPEIVCGVGGYVTGPVLLAAKLKNIPLCIHEQNSVPGLANQITAKIADKIFISIPGEYNFSPQKIVFSGNPVRREIISAAPAERIPKERKNLLILGGSQGAHQLNVLMQESAKLLQNNFAKSFQITHQTGNKDVQAVRKTYHELGVQAEVRPFFDNMAGLYQNADLVISRAGATTLAELSVMGLPAILIPFPYAADNHQMLNGRYYVNHGGAKMFKEKDLSAPQLAKEISSLLRNHDDLRNMSVAMKKLSRPEATTKIINQFLTLLENKYSAR